MKHACHAVGCSIEVPPLRFMCRAHWFMVPKTLRDEIWREYVPGQERRKNPTPAYLNVSRQCINFVATFEGGRVQASDGDTLS